MKSPLFILVAGLFISADATFAAGVTIPQRQPPESYQKMTEDWPFALATAVVPVAEPEKGWASNYYVGGIAEEFKDGKKQVFVAIKARDQQSSFSLYGNETNKDGFSVEKIEWSDKIGTSLVTLRKGSEIGVIKFDEITLQQPSQMNPQQIRQGMPNVPGMKQPMIRPPGAPGAAVPRPTIPQPAPQAAPLPGGPSNTNAAPPPSNTNVAPQNPKQRVRVIKSTP